MDEAVEVIGLPAFGELSLYGAPGLPRLPDPPEPEALTFTLRYRSQVYGVIMARTLGGARKLGPLVSVEDWMQKNKGWWVRVSGLDGEQFSAPYPTVEAAIVAPYLFLS